MLTIPFWDKSPPPPSVPSPYVVLAMMMLLLLLLMIVLVFFRVVVVVVWMRMDFLILRIRIVVGVPARLLRIIGVMMILLRVMMRGRWTGHVVSTVGQVRAVLHAHLMAVVMWHVSLRGLHHRRLNVGHKLRHYSLLCTDD